MVLVDTSAWGEYLCGTGSPYNTYLRDAILAIVALRTGSPVLVLDRDVDALAHVSDLVLEHPKPWPRALAIWARPASELRRLSGPSSQ
jgi:hypothetical protein